MDFSPLQNIGGKTMLMLCDKCEGTEGPLCSGCSEQESERIMDLRGWGVDLLDRSKEEIRIKWEVYICHETNPEIERKMNLLLLSLRVFSKGSSRGWRVLTGGILVGPCLREYYFTRKEDVMEYSQVKFGKATYSHEVIHVDEAYRRR